MSRLIFEGDTTKRFGEKFPKPFIQEIRVFDNAIEADIVLYFKVSLEENVEAFIGNLSDYDLYSGFGNKSFRNEINLENFNIVNEEIFNSEGERFIKLMLEKRIDFDGLSGESSTGGGFTSFDLGGPDPIALANYQLELNRMIQGADRDAITATAARIRIEESVDAMEYVEEREEDSEPDAMHSVESRETPLIDAADIAREVSRGEMEAAASMSGIVPSVDLGGTSSSPSGTGTGGSSGGMTDRPSGVGTDGIIETPDIMITSTYFYCCTTIKEEETSNLHITQDLMAIDPTGEYARIANSSSPLIYERIFKPDGTLSIDPVDAFQEIDGNIYRETPLLSLDRRYRKTDNITHRTVIDNVNAVIAPYVGTDITEADNIAAALQTQKDDPSLLVEISKRTKNFSNKSSVTPTGTLYGSMVDVVTSLDNALLLEDVLEKRRFANAKIKDRRGDISLVKNGDFTEGLNLFPSYIYKPLISRGAVKTAAGNTIREEDVLESFIISNQSYYFFDYEKCLNYETEISSFFNPYNLLQIFGNNTLNGYFKIVSVSLEKSKAHSHRPGDAYSVTNLDLLYPTGDGGLLGGSNIASSYTYETTDSDNNFLSKTIEKRFSGGALDTSIIKNTIYSQIAERAFDTLDSIDGYRLKCYEIVDLESIEMAERATTYVAKIEVKDTTMHFYKEHLQQPILKMYEDLKRYLDLADDFCSFNNIDGKFNDFFVDSIGTQFDSPFPWHEGPLLYYSVLASLEASWDGMGFEERKRTGSSVDLDLIKQNAILKSRQISPLTGDLISLQDFINDFEVFKNYFEVGAGLDKNNEIFRDLFGGIVMLKNQSVSKTFEITTQITEDINASFDLSPDETETTFSPYLVFAKGSLFDPTVVRTQAAMQFYIDNIDEQQRVDLALNLSNMTKKGDSTTRLYSEEGIRWGDMFVNYSNVNSEIESETKEILQVIFPYLRHLQSMPFSSHLSISDILPAT